MVDRQRIREIQSGTQYGGPVLYWMSREMRIQDNWALQYACEIARELHVGVIVAYNLHATYLGGGRRHFDFKYSALQELEKACDAKGIPFRVFSGRDPEAQMVRWARALRISATIVDMSPLRIQQRWNRAWAKALPQTAFYEVDAHNIVPVWAASDHQEFAARTMRPKLYRHMPQYLTEFPSVPKQDSVGARQLDTLRQHIGENDWVAITTLAPPEDNSKVDWIAPGEQAAANAVAEWIDSMEGYADRRNEPALNAQSGLSPYIHYGMVAPQRIVLHALSTHRMSPQTVFDARRNGAGADMPYTGVRADVAAFLEELVIRRELADNFCFYNPRYDSVEGFPEWARKTLDAHRGDSRAYTYSLQEFEEAKTHDDAWNAAQRQMVQTGKMHGYMRMYWAKKILEWSNTPEDAMQTAITLNDRYELDGRDPNGYVGISWAIGGVHDRPWSERPIFGTVRYMNAAGLKRKFDIDAYCRVWIAKNSLF